MNVYIWENVTTAGIYHSSTLGLITIADGNGNDVTIADKNLGASAAGTTSGSYGDYYCWGSTSNCNGQVTSSYTMQEDWSLGTQSIAPTGYHIPTQDEFTNLLSLYQTLTSRTTSADFQADLLVPLAGQKLAANTTISYAGTGGYLWTQEKTSSNGYFFRVANLNIGNAGMTSGFSVRLFKDTPVSPDDTWTIIYNGGLWNYNKIISMSEQGQAVLTELNKYPADYYNKLNSEGHIMSDGIADSTGQNYQIFNDGSGNYGFMLYNKTSYYWILDV